MSKENTVKNRAPAPIQISAEQILREAAERTHQIRPNDPITVIHDAEEYQSHLRSRRKHFEDNIRYRREHMGNWVKYARFEEDNKEFERARSIMERAMEVEGGRNSELWLRYAELEMRNEFVNRARNVLDRAVSILPRVDFLWYKYVYMEEMMEDVGKCRGVFERWMKWNPDDNAWLAYARFEMRKGGEGGRRRANEVMRRYVNSYPCVKSFLKYAKWAEYEGKDYDLARTVYESTLTELEPEECRNARVFKAFASFEERRGEYERARVIYNHAIKLLNLGNSSSSQQKNLKDEEDDDDITQAEKKRRDDLYKSYVSFEKKHGDRRGIEHVVLTKQRSQYEQRVKKDPRDYDSWFEYAKLEEDYGSFNDAGQDDRNEVVDHKLREQSAAKVRDVYERAVANLPPTQEKKHWKRYIYLWIYYALFEELQMSDQSRASEIYKTCLSLIPHHKFTFSKIWIQAAKLHIRRKDLTSARKLLGTAIGRCSKNNNNPSKTEKIYVEYIALELSLGEIDRGRKLYGGYLQAMPYNCVAWSRFADLERSVGETERCRSIYELAIRQPVLDRPEMLWKAYIDFEIEEGEGEKARALYDRLLERTGHVKVWISFAQFEGTELGGGVEKAREVFGRGYGKLKEEGLKEERVLLLDAWRVFEKAKGDGNGVADVEAKMPRRVKRKRMRTDEQTGEELGWEEYFDYHFPDDGGSAANNLKILEMAAKWKKRKLDEGKDDDSDDSDESDDDDEEEEDSDDNQ